MHLISDTNVRCYLIRVRPTKRLDQIILRLVTCTSTAAYSIISIRASAVMLSIICLLWFSAIFPIPTWSVCPLHTSPEGDEVLEATAEALSTILLSGFLLRHSSTVVASLSNRHVRAVILSASSLRTYILSKSRVASAMS